MTVAALIVLLAALVLLAAARLAQGRRGPARPLDPGSAEEARALKAQGRDVQAVKLVRERTGMGLLEAKQRVDDL